MSRVVVCLSSIPPRFKDLGPVINSLHCQSRKPDKIYLHISKYYERFNLVSSIDSLPKSIFKYPSLQVCEGDDYGPINKLFVGLENENDHNTIIVTVDDDRIYNKDLIKTIEERCDISSDCAFGIKGRLLGRDLKYGKSKRIISSEIKKDKQVDIVTAVQGWAYRRGFFKSGFIDDWKQYRKLNPIIFFNDDIWISAQLEILNIPKIVIGNVHLESENWHGDDDVGLYMSSVQRLRNDKNLNLFKDIWKCRMET